LPEILAEVLRAGVEEGDERARRNFEAKIEDADTTIGRLPAGSADAPPARSLRE
jgi:hypothetical protein